MDSKNDLLRWRIGLAFLLVSMTKYAFLASSFTPQSGHYYYSHSTSCKTFTSRILNSNIITQRNVKSAEADVAPSAAPMNTSGKGFAKTKDNNIDDRTITNTEEEEKEDHMNEIVMKMNPTQIKEKLLDLLPRMTGTKEEFQFVQSYINALEAKFIAPQTLDFFNLAMVGEWQFLFTSNQLGRPSPRLRLTELIQKVDVSGFDGKLTNQATWALAQDGMTFNVSGTFASSVSYKINQGARMTINDDHDLTINMAKGSKVPHDTQELVGLIFRAMPSEMFDSSNLAIDTTYLDTDIRIVRFTGSRHEGVRNVFMRKGLIEIHPSGMD